MIDLSVVIAARNEERHLPEQLLAIQTQAIQPREIVLVDDGSTDRTAEIMHDFARYTRRVRMIRFECSVGATAAYNRGVAESSGEHIYCASANDVVRTGALSWLAQALEMWPGAEIVAGDLDGLALGWSRVPTSFSGDEMSDLIGRPHIVHGAAAVVSRRAWDICGGWHDDVGGYVDTLMWHTLACRYGLVYTPHPIAWVRPNAPGQGNGAAALDTIRRAPLLEAFARRVMAMEEPTRSRLVNSALWGIREFAPEMHALLTERARAAAAVVS